MSSLSHHRHHYHHHPRRHRHIVTSSTSSSSSSSLSSSSSSSASGYCSCSRGLARRSRGEPICSGRGRGSCHGASLPLCGTAAGVSGLDLTLEPELQKLKATLSSCSQGLRRKLIKRIKRRCCRQPDSKAGLGYLGSLSDFGKSDLS